MLDILSKNNIDTSTIDYEFCRKTHNHLKGKTNKEILQDYHNNSEINGLVYHPNQNFNYLKSKIDKIKNISILEIGPLDSPKFIGTGVKYMDVKNYKDLVKMSAFHKRNGNVPYIDYVCSDGRLTNIKEKFDIVFSSHCIEHTECLATHLNDISLIIKNDGICLLTIPDKRYCFDHYGPLTKISDVIDTFYSSEKTTLRHFLNHFVFKAHNDPVRHWAGDHGDISHLKLKRIKKALSDYNSEKKYDLHRLRFTPLSFVNIVNSLYNLKITNIKVKTLYKTKKNSFDFISILKKSL